MIQKYLVPLAALGVVISWLVTAGECAPDKKAAYRKKRIELVVSYPPQGIMDLAARALASVLPDFLSQPVVDQACRNAFLMDIDTATPFNNGFHMNPCWEGGADHP